MPEPSFKVKERKDYLKLKQMETRKEASSGKEPKHRGVIQFSVDEYNKPVSREKTEE